MFCTCCGEKLKMKKRKCHICKQSVLPLKETNGYSYMKTPEKKKRGKYE